MKHQNEIEIYTLNNFNKSFDIHFHDYYVLGVINHGSRNMLCNGVEYLLNAGDAVIFNPFDVHSCKKSGSVPMRYFALNIEKTFAASLFRDKIPIFQNVIKSSELPPSFYEELRNVKLAKVLKKLPHTIYSYTACDGSFDPEIEMVCRIINQNLSNNISLEFLASFAGFSKSTLLRKFSEQKRITPYRYIKAMRINKAKSLLLKGASLLETAFLTGFSSQSHFTNSFKKIIEISPSAYKKDKINE